MASVCVFSGASQHVAEHYKRVARELGHVLGELGIELIYGGASVGLMGELADATLASGARVVGVMPGFLVEKEIAHQGLSELLVVPSMHERKAVMAARADAFIAMPGGFGTLDELFEITTWSQLGLHARPIGLLNVAHFFDPLLSFVLHAKHEGFIKSGDGELWIQREDPRELCRALQLGPSASSSESNTSA